MKVITQQYNNYSDNKKSVAPLTSYWNSVRVIRNHSITACCNDILNANITSEVVTVNMLGPPSSGKTTCAKTMAHIIHKESRMANYNVLVLTKEDLLNFEETLSKLKPTNYVLIFDDVSFLAAHANKKQIDVVKSAFTRIRHLAGGVDVRIIVFKNFHYSYGMDKYLRQSDFNMYFDVGSEELENIQKAVGMKYNKMLHEFIQIKTQIKKTSTVATEEKPEYRGNFSYQIGRTLKFTYEHRAPMAPALFWDKTSLRHVVFPKREWIDPICNACTEVETDTKEVEEDLSGFIETLEKEFDRTTIIQAIKIKGAMMGFHFADQHVQRTMLFMDKYFKYKLINFQALAKHYKLKERKRQLQNYPIAPEIIEEHNDKKLPSTQSHVDPVVNE